jgi:TRAP-type uncharacterized transport system substrate-binding protein
MYILKYLAENKEKINSGELPQVLVPSESGLIRWVNEGWPPLQKVANPEIRAFTTMPAIISLMVTFDPEIKTMADLAGKKVGTAERARLFQNDFANRPYFDKGLKIWDKIKWEYLGSINSKDALLNKKIDVKQSYFMGNIEIAEDGTYVCTKLSPEAPTLELMEAGRKLNLIGWDPKLIKQSYDFSKHMALMPILIKKGAFKGIDHDIWGRFSTGQFQGLASMPDDVLQEIFRVRITYQKELEKYHAMMALLPKTPYPIGTPKQYVHPGMEKIMKNLELAIPMEK